MGQPRVQVIDFLRGAALFGILAVNSWFFVPPQAQGWAHDLTNLLFATKAYLLFAFLFGYSFDLQRRAAHAAGRPFGPMMRRRLAGLAVLGLLNGLLLFEGDILLPYALLGFLLLRYRDLPQRRLARLAVLVTAVTATGLAGLGTLAWLAEQTGSAAAQAAPTAGPPVDGSLPDVVASHTVAYLPTLLWVLAVQSGPAFAAMLVGLAAARCRLLEGRADEIRIAPAAVLVGALGAALFAYGLASGRASVGLIAFGVTTLTAPLLTATYAALLVRLARRRPDAAAVRAIAAAGRCSLTNYLAQSLALNAFLLVAAPVRGAAVLPVALAIYSLLLVLSHWWLRTHRYGPAELLLRRWTYRALPLTADRPHGPVG